MNWYLLFWGRGAVTEQITQDKDADVDTGSQHSTVIRHCDHIWGVAVLDHYIISATLGESFFRWCSLKTFPPQVLLDKAGDPSLQQQLLRGYDMLMNPQKMGERFHFFALLPHQRLHVGSQGGKACQSEAPSTSVPGFDELVWHWYFSCLDYQNKRNSLCILKLT